jgi:hypothetical protein
MTRSLAGRRVLAAVDAVLLTRPPVSDFVTRPSAREQAAPRAQQRDVVVETVVRDNRVGGDVRLWPFGHTRQSA